MALKNSDNKPGQDEDNGRPAVVAGRKRILTPGREGFFVLVMSIVIVASAWGVLQRVEEGARSDVGKSLGSALENSHNSFRNQLKIKENAAIVWAGNPRILRAVSELLELPKETAVLIASPAQKALRSLITPVFDIVGYRGYFIIDRDYLNLASSRDGNIGDISLLAKQRDFLDRVLAGKTLMSLPQVSDVPLADSRGEILREIATMFVATPIRNDAGLVIAVLAFRLDPAREFTPVFKRSRVGDSGETYAFDRDGLLISESRFNDDLLRIGLIGDKGHSVLHVEIRDPGVNMLAGEKPPLPRDEQPLTRMAASATAGQSGSDLIGYRDYRGVPVVGVWLWDDSLGFGITSEMDVAEAFASFYDVRFVIIVFSGISISVLMVLGVVSARSRALAAENERRLRESEETLAAAIENVSGGFILCDRRNRILLFNKRFRFLYPGSYDLLVKGAGYEDFLRGGAERGEYADIGGSVDEWIGGRLPGSHESEKSYEQPLAGERWVNISIGGIPEGGWVAIHSDITPLKEAMAAADAANKAKSEFLSSMSHELRTPMNAILGFAQMLEYNPKEPLSATQKESVDLILKGGKHLLELINDVLDLARIEAGKVEISFEDISPGVILEECVSLLSPMAAERGIEISIPRTGQDIPRVRADHTRFKQVLINLMNNAVKYNRENGTVFVNIEVPAGNMMRLTVTDTGEGISRDRQNELFKPFSRLGAENSEIEGTGIGLVVCKDLVSLMNGSIGVESEVGKGSSFWIELPLAQDDDHLAGRAADRVAALADAASGGPSGSLLYIEDNPDNLKLMELIVSHMPGMSMISTHTGELGVEMARAERPDLIILDINLPGMNGIETLEKLKNHAVTAHIPVLALSAAATRRDIEKGVQAGFLCYLTKPVMVPEVMKAIETAMEMKR